MSLVQNAADKGQVKSAEKEVRWNRETELSDLKEILSTGPGRRFVWRYLEACGVFKISMHASGSQTFFNEGQRNIGLMLLSDVTEADADSYLQMIKDSKRRTK